MTMNSRRSLAILGYHGVTAARSPLNDWCYLEAPKFAEQMRWLAGKRVDVLPLTEAVSALSDGGLRRNSVVLTFDDGYRDNVEVALPILREYGFAATIFLTTGLTDTSRALWPGRIVSALERTSCSRIEWGGESFDLAGEDARRRANSGLQRLVKIHAAGNPDGAAAEIEQILGVPEEVAAPDTSPHAMMTSRDIATALESGLVSFGAHTVTHPILSALDDSRLEEEIIGSIEAVERITGQPCQTFAYPNGGATDFDDRAVALLQKRGVTTAVTTVEGLNFRSSDPMRLYRWNIGQITKPAVFKGMLRGYHPAAIRARLRHLGFPLAS
jgi:peptidoglycan/xylan/chitin deacetylase (PgdA/CDA1 family)